MIDAAAREGHPATLTRVPDEPDNHEFPGIAEPPQVDPLELVELVEKLPHRADLDDAVEVVEMVLPCPDDHESLARAERVPDTDMVSVARVRRSELPLRALG